MKLCIRVFPDDQGGYVADCPSLPGCVSHGNSCEEATGRLDEAIRGYIAAVSNFVPENLVHEVIELPRATEVVS